MSPNKKQFDGYFLTADSWPDGQCIVLQGPWRDEFLPAFDDNNIVSLRLSQSMGWQPEKLQFLDRLPELRGIEIYHHDVKDITPLAHLERLEHIGLDCNYSSAADFTAFPHLTHCFVRWRPKAKTLLSVPSLKHLNISGYPYQDLTPLNALTKLNVLKLASRKLRTLHGVEQLSRLTAIDLFRCMALESINQLRDANCSLQTIIIDTCKRIGDIEALRSSSGLRALTLNNCGPIQSLLPVRNCMHLEELYFAESTNILDGDLSILLKLGSLKSTSFANRRHYSHTREQIQNALTG